MIYLAIFAQLIVFEENGMQVTIPECPLAENAVEVSNQKPFNAWTDEDHKDEFHLINRMAQVWHGMGISDYLSYTTIEPQSEKPFKREIVPFPSDGWSFLDQAKVLWNTAFGAPCLSIDEREKLATQLKERSIAPLTKTASEEKDPFLDPNVLKTQTIFEGKEIFILYNYAPIASGEKLHFLIIPKERKERLTDLSDSEYAEVMQLEQKLVNHYRSKNYTAFLFNKSGKKAGQTVPHFHEHVVFSDAKADEWLARLNLLKNMIFGYSPLSKEELKQKVESLKEELTTVL